MSNIGEADLELLLDIYVSAKYYVPVKDRLKWADAFLLQLKDFDIELQLNAEEITGVDEYLEEAFDTIIHDNEDEDDNWYDEDEDE